MGCSSTRTRLRADVVSLVLGAGHGQPKTGLLTEIARPRSDTAVAGCARRTLLVCGVGPLVPGNVALFGKPPGAN